MKSISVVPKLENTHESYGIYEKYIKPALDFIFSLILLILFWWLYAFIAILVWIKLGKPILFTQERPGKIDKETGEEKVFKLYKFRSMTNEKDCRGKLLPGSKRMTLFGEKLRATSLDELPELFNILKGDMSFIGPRPLAVSYLPYYINQERNRHFVRPGLTGLAQVNGRNNINWETKFKYDLYYVNHISFLMDCKIIIKTIKAVLLHEGIGQGKDSPISFHIYRKNELEKGIDIERLYE